MNMKKSGKDLVAMLQVCLLLPLLALFGAAHADYADDWGPELGVEVPLLEALDQDGQLRDLDSLTGDQGLLLFLNRSADW